MTPMNGASRVFLVLALAAPPAAADVVERRGTEPPLEGEIVGLDDAGVRVRSRTGAEHFVPWDRVRRVDSAMPLLHLDRSMKTAEELWRARSRVERFDTALAEPLLERLFEQYRGRSHETALVVAEGLLRCRLARGDQILALLPALETARLRRAGITTGSYAGLAAVIDPGTFLCPQLPPVWIPTPLLDSLERGLAGYDARGDAVIAAIASLYLEALRRSRGAPPGDGAVPGPGPLPDHPGVEFLSFLLDSSAAAPEQRRAARERLERAPEKLPEWAEAWARFHIGLSLLGESGLGRRQQGMVSLMHLPARFERRQPYLAGLALAYVAAALEQTGDVGAADTIRAQVARSFPLHPLLAAGVQRIRPPQFAERPSPPKESQ